MPTSIPLRSGDASPVTAAGAFLLLVAALVLAGCMQTTNNESNGSDADLQWDEHPELGSILVDTEGMTLYIFTNDAPGESNCYDQCAINWPPLYAEETPEADADIQSRLSLVERDNETRMQVAIDDQPLYYFFQDQEAGDANGEGVNDVWFVVREDEA